MLIDYDVSSIIFIDMSNYNIITETKNVKFFEHIYPPNIKISHVTKTLKLHPLILRKLIVILNLTFR